MLLWRSGFRSGPGYAGRTRPGVHDDFSGTWRITAEYAWLIFATTSIYFEGDGGETLGEYGYSKDHRPDRRQMVVGVVIDGRGIPLCCEMWPGNTTDVVTIKEVVKRFQNCFGIRDVCINEAQARKDAHDREAIVASLRDKLKTGDKALVGNSGYRKFLKNAGKGHFEIDEGKLLAEARFDGKWVLTTNTALSPSELALQYKQLRKSRPRFPANR